jgi:preprotein translocase subunit Sec61beta
MVLVGTGSVLETLKLDPRMIVAVGSASALAAVIAAANSAPLLTV